MKALKQMICSLMAFVMVFSLAGRIVFGGTYTFVDDYVDSSLMHESSTKSNFSFATSDQSGKHGIKDRNRMLKTSHDGTLDTQSHVVYQFDHTMASFSIDSIYMKKSVGGVVKMPEDLTFAVSVDGVNYEPFTAISRTVEREDSWEANYFRGVTFTSNGEIPVNARYLRITLGSTKVVNDRTTLQLLKTTVTLNEDAVDYRAELETKLNACRELLGSTEIGDGHGMVPAEMYQAFEEAVDAAADIYNQAGQTQAVYETALRSLDSALSAFLNSVIVKSDRNVVDYCDSFSLLADYHADIGIAASSPDKMGNDNARFYRKSQQKGGYVTYQAAEGYMFSSFTVDAWYNKANNQISEDITIEASEDGVSFTPVTASRTVENEEDWPNNGWRMIVFHTKTIPSGTKYIKVSFGDSTKTGAAWAIQIGTITYDLLKDYKQMLGQALSDARQLHDNTAVGTASGNCTQEAKTRLAEAIDTAEQIYQASVSLKALEEAYVTLQAELDVFKNSIIYLLRWQEGAKVSVTQTTSKSISISWNRAVGGNAVVYSIYVDGEKRAETADTHYTLTDLAIATEYSIGIVASEGEEFTSMLGPVVGKTGELEPVPAPDFSKLTVNSFSDWDYLAPLQWPNDTRGIPYYYYNLHRVLNSVVMSGENKGYVDIFISRTYKAFTPNNIRIQEAYLPITYFYALNEPWNIYYNMPEVKIRLEAVIEHALSLQKDTGAFPQNSDATYDLAGTTFFLNFIGQTVRLLKEEEKRNDAFASISPELMERIRAASEKAIKYTLNNDAWWSYGTEYSNQYGLIWSATAAYLEYYPNAEIEALLREKYAQSDAFISPAGFYYEEKGFDFNYNLGVHANNIAAEYHYFKDTEYEEQLLAEQSKFFDWISYNLVIEPDGSWYTPNAAASKRISSLNNAIYRKSIPLAEKIPIARAFVRSESDVEADVEKAKAAITKNGAWPVIPELTLNGGNSYNAYGIFEKLFDSYTPTDEEKQAAIDSLPYIANEDFTQVRGDARAGVEFSFIRRPGYYTIFNAANKANNMQSYGLGLLWHPEGGIMMSSNSENKETTGDNNLPVANDMSWGTKPYYQGENQGIHRVYENAALIPQSYKLNGTEVKITDGIQNLEDGDYEITYRLGKGAGTKTIRCTDDTMDVSISHSGAFQECFPLMVRAEDKFEVHEDRFVLIRGRAVMEIKFDRPVTFDVVKKSYVRSRYTMHMLSAKAEDELSYTISMRIEEPQVQKLREKVQVTIDQITTDTDQPTQPTQPTQPAQPTPSTPDGEREPDAVQNDIDFLVKNGYLAQEIKALDPDAPITRAQFTAMVVSAFDIAADTSNYADFADVSPDAPYYQAVKAAREIGLVRGISEDLFEPDSVIALEEMELIAFRAQEYKRNKVQAGKNNLATVSQAASVLRRLAEAIQ